MKKKLAEQPFYEQALNEIESGKQNEALWVKALETSEGDTVKLKSLYIALRAKSLEDKTVADSTTSKESDNIAKEMLELQANLKVARDAKQKVELETNLMIAIGAKQEVAREVKLNAKQ